MKKTLPRSPNPESKLPSWMQKGIFLRDIPNEKDLEMNHFNVPRTPLPESQAQKKLKAAKTVKPRENNAEKYLGILYLEYLKLMKP